MTRDEYTQRSAEAMRRWQAASPEAAAIGAVAMLGRSCALTLVQLCAAAGIVAATDISWWWTVPITLISLQTVGRLYARMMSPRWMRNLEGAVATSEAAKMREQQEQP